LLIKFILITRYLTSNLILVQTHVKYPIA